MLRFRNTQRVPADHGVPADLPPWARDELVRRRVESNDLRAEVLRLRVELARERGHDVGYQLREVMREAPEAHG